MSALLVAKVAMAAGEPAAEIPSLAPMLKQVLPGVVSIAVHGRTTEPENPLLSDPFFRKFFGLPEEEEPPQREFQAAGSGVVVDAGQGYVLTENHLVENADEITVALGDGRRIKADRIGTDPSTDLAVLRINVRNLTALPLGDSEQLQVGDFVVAVGNPFGLSQTATMGIVSALGRTGLGIEGYENFIQTDAPINPGNSGGALVNLRGELVGINSAIIGPAGGNVGIGFAIPINMAKEVMAELIAHGEIKRGQLGITVQDLTEDLAKALKLDITQGALVSEVVHGSPAEKAGVKAGDVIVKVNGQPVTATADLRNKIGLLRIGAKVRITLLRKGASRDITAVLTQIKSARLKVPADLTLLATVVLGSIEPDSQPVEGATVLEVGKHSPAGQAGLSVGDVIISVNQQPVHSPEEVVAVAEQNKQTLLLQVIRKGSRWFIVIS